MKAFVVFGHKTFYTKSPWRLFSFYWPIFIEGFDCKTIEKVPKMLLKIVPIKCQT